MATKICPNCNIQFELQSSRQTYCKRKLTTTCVVCGDAYEYVCGPEIPSTCSKESCRISYKLSHSAKTCPICGTKYQSLRKQTYCKNDHRKKCIICGNSFVVPYHRLDQYNDINTCGSKECANAIRIPKIRAHIATLDKGWNQSKQVYHRTCEECGKPFITNKCNQKYCSNAHYRTCSVCGESYLCRNEVLGATDSPTTCSIECSRIKASKTSLFKYGVSNYSQTEEWKQRVSNIADIQNAKRIQTNIAKYGTENYSQTLEWKRSQMVDPTKSDKLEEFYADPVAYIHNTYNIAPTINQLSSDLGINTTSMLATVHRLDLDSYVSIHHSSYENELMEFLISLGINCEISQNNRQLIKPLELDIVINDIAFEMNPTATHNSSNALYNSQDAKPIKYHQHKTDMCEDKGIFLFHIFGYEWTHKRPIVESMIRNLLGCNIEKIFARKCEIREVTNSLANEFLDANHRQGSVNGSIRYGLYHNDELVSLMTFSKMRNTIGTGTEDLSDCYELLRFCNKLNTSVVGGASKLFKHFIRQHNPTRIRSFSDRAHTRGNLYKQLNFKEIRRSDPGYVWVDADTDIAYSRINAQKQNIKKFLHDDTIDLTQSESQIMEDHGYVRVYDSGTITWEWTNTSL